MLPAGLGLAPLASASAASPDQVSISTAVYYKNHSYQQKLEIIASDTNTSATLTAYVTSTGQQIGLPEGGGQPSKLGAAPETARGLRRMVLDAASLPALPEASAPEALEPPRTKKSVLLALYRAHPHYGDRSRATGSPPS
jgi:hypothetical protein